MVDIVIYACWQRKVVTFEQLSRISFVRYFPAGRDAPPGSNGISQRLSAGWANSQPGTPSGATRREYKHPQQAGNLQSSGLAGVTKGWWSGWRLAATVVVFTFRKAQSARVNIKRSNFMPVPETTEKPAKQQEYLEDAVMFNKRADYGTGRYLLNIIALPDFLRKSCTPSEKPEDHGASNIPSARRRKLSTPLVQTDKPAQS
ncbi:hypothetical protein [Bacteroides congonensis]|uniref:hypothetical protein n=1 Tax=Bacteroides congonensis TaxID=1871006 RepID=UPI002FDAC750